MTTLAKPTAVIPSRAMAAPWPALTEAERDQAIAAARAEGRRAARWFLEEPADGSPTGLSLRGSRWAQAHGGLEALPDDAFHLYAAAATVPDEADYVEWVIETHCPERAARWWACDPVARQKDPRICAFCDAYERERCHILALPEPPTGAADLQLYITQAKEQEREAGRAWLESTEATYESAGEAETQRSIARWEYQRLMLCTDLDGMLLDAAVYRSAALSARREIAKGAKTRNRRERKAGAPEQR
jgi:hypothetical protein